MGTTREPDTESRNFIETHNVTEVSPKAVPGSGEEAADLLKTGTGTQAERQGGIEPAKRQAYGRSSTS
jgi:hypothetical protein